MSDTYFWLLVSTWVVIFGLMLIVIYYDYLLWHIFDKLGKHLKEWEEYKKPKVLHTTEVPRHVNCKCGFIPIKKDKIDDIKPGTAVFENDVEFKNIRCDKCGKTKVRKTAWPRHAGIIPFNEETMESISVRKFGICECPEGDSE